MVMPMSWPETGKSTAPTRFCISNEPQGRVSWPTSSLTATGPGSIILKPACTFVARPTKRTGSMALMSIVAVRGGCCQQVEL